MIENRDRVALEDLLLQLEREWMRHHDPHLLDRLTAEHPGHAEEIVDFFSFLIDVNAGLLDEPEHDARLAAYATEWFDSKGLALAHRLSSDERARTAKSTPSGGTAGAPASSPHRGGAQATGPQTRGSGGLSLLGLLTRTTGRKPSEVSAALGVTGGFMAAVSAHHETVPERVREEIAGRAQAHLGVDRESVLRCLASLPDLPAAASREAAYENRRLSWSDVVRMAGLGGEDERFWLSLGED